MTTAARARCTILKPIAGDGAGYLIIDDLVDTGDTARAVREMLPKAHFATVYAKPAGRPTGRYLRHRGEPGHLDPVPLGHRAAIRAAHRQRPRRAAAP